MVSGTISLPSRGAFHLSLTVLVHYRSLGVFSLARWSSRIPTGFHVSRRTQDPERREPGFVYWTITISGVASQPLRLPDSLVTPKFSPTTPLSKLSGLGSSRFARRYSGNRIFFLFLQLLRCFSSLRLPLGSYEFTAQVIID